MHSDEDDAALPAPGCPIREPRDQRLFDSYPGRFAVYYALHRLLAPRHPPYTLSSLTTQYSLSRNIVCACNPNGLCTIGEVGHFSRDSVVKEQSSTCQLTGFQVDDLNPRDHVHLLGSRHHCQRFRLEQ